MRALIAEADVLIENFRVGSLARFGLDYPTIAKLNPRLVYCSITGFGQTGPHAALAGYDFVIQGISGIMDLTGDPGGAPQKMGVAFADIMTGLYGVIAIQAALAQRQTTGAGQHIDMALLDVMVGVLANQGLNYLVSGTSPTRLGNAHPNIAPYEAFPTSDGWIILAVGSNHQFQKFCSVIGMPELERDARFASNAQRLAHLEELRARITAQTRLWQRDALLERLAAACVPAGPINNVEQAYAHPQVRHRAMTTTMQRSSDGVSVPVIRLPITASGMALGAGEPSPRLGNHAGCGQPGPTLVEDAATGGARR